MMKDSGAINNSNNRLKPGLNDVLKSEFNSGPNDEFNEESLLSSSTTRAFKVSARHVGKHLGQSEKMQRSRWSEAANDLF